MPGEGSIPVLITGADRAELQLESSGFGRLFTIATWRNGLRCAVCCLHASIFEEFNRQSRGREDTVARCESLGSTRNLTRSSQQRRAKDVVAGKRKERS